MRCLYVKTMAALFLCCLFGNILEAQAVAPQCSKIFYTPYPASYKAGWSLRKNVDYIMAEKLARPTTEATQLLKEIKTLSAPDVVELSKKIESWFQDVSRLGSNKFFDYDNALKLHPILVESKMFKQAEIDTLMRNIVFAFSVDSNGSLKVNAFSREHLYLREIIRNSRNYDPVADAKMDQISRLWMELERATHFRKSLESDVRINTIKDLDQLLTNIESLSVDLKKELAQDKLVNALLRHSRVVFSDTVNFGDRIIVPSVLVVGAKEKSQENWMKLEREFPELSKLLPHEKDEFISAMTDGASESAYVYFLSKSSVFSTQKLNTIAEKIVSLKDLKAVLEDLFI